MSEFTDETRSKLREPFRPEQIGKLSKAKMARGDGAKRCRICGSKHEYPDVDAVHVDYVGHAVVTGRLNDVVGPGCWSYTLNQVAERDGHITGVVGTMTIAGRTIGQEVGTPAKPDMWGEELKTAISDYIRRAAMRFGVALDLWSKQELESGEVGERSAADVGREAAGDSATIQAGPGGGRRKGASNVHASAANSSEPGRFPGSGSDQTPELGPPGSGGPDPEQREDRTAAPGSGATLKAFGEVCKGLGLSGQDAAQRLREGGWTLPQAWWKTIDRWDHDDLAEAIEYLETGGQDPPAQPEAAKAS